MSSEVNIIREAIELSLQEWAVDRSRHSSFWDASTRRVLKYSSNKEPHPLNMLELENAQLPRDPEEAIRHVLLAALREISDGSVPSLRTVHDRLQVFFPPFYKGRDRYTGKICLIPCKGFGRLVHNDPAALDPFRRFKYTHYDSPAEYVAEAWDTDSVGGLVLEAMVACHLELTKCCWSCGKPAVLRWNGGFSAASTWADVVCINCHATYEIKSRKNQEEVRKAMVTYNKIRGGSFLAFSRFQTRGERFLVMVGRTPERDEQGPYHLLTVAVIDLVVPKLTNDSFNLDDGDEMYIGSEISIKPETRKSWCIVPACKLSYYEVTASVYDKVFGPGEWKKRVASARKWTGEEEDSLVNTIQGLQISHRTTPWGSNFNRNNLTPHWNRPPTTRQATIIGPRYGTATSRPGYRQRNMIGESSIDSIGDQYMSDFDHKQQRKYKKSSW